MSETEQNVPNDDFISRKRAIDALERKKDKNAKGDIGGFYNKIIQNDIDTLMQMPSAQPEQRWIPVTDHLPDEDIPVLVTDDAGGMATVGIDSCGRYEDTGERFWYTSQNVTAWMYTIEPYGGEQE